mmetsp:Transcript_9913/g.24120  ORF Transcript_9913/g.24120 Transcript_9913/m.24120 type:complete len:245 (-) Transcript_9913:1632-2366(-)
MQALSYLYQCLCGMVGSRQKLEMQYLRSDQQHPLGLLLSFGRRRLSIRSIRTPGTFAKCCRMDRAARVHGPSSAGTNLLFRFGCQCAGRAQWHVGLHGKRHQEKPGRSSGREAHEDRFHHFRQFGSVLQFSVGLGATPNAGRVIAKRALRTPTGQPFGQFARIAFGRGFLPGQSSGDVREKPRSRTVLLGTSLESGVHRHETGRRENVGVPVDPTEHGRWCFETKRKSSDNGIGCRSETLEVGQ